MLPIADYLGPGGLLARRVEGFAHRPAQHAMARAVAEALEEGGILICEAGTGTGKTFAYLVPALLSGRKVVVSTGTRNLQDQLYQRDVPRVRDVLGTPSAVAVLKGRANYLCQHRLEGAWMDGRHRSRELADLLSRVRGWAARTERGDIAELVDIPEDAPVWPLVTSTADNCLGQECPSHDRCHLVEARRQAQAADVVIVNHHLLCADFALRDDGFGELLPTADCYIVDEAHQLPDTASDFFGRSVTARQLLDLARDVEVEARREACDPTNLAAAADPVGRAVRDLRLAFGVEARRSAWAEVAAAPAVVAASSRLSEALAELAARLDAAGGRGKGLDNCLARAQTLGRELTVFRAAEEGAGEIRWLETFQTGFRLNRTPLDISETFRTQLSRRRGTWVFTSATLAVGGDYGHFRQRLGIDEARTERWDSPFDYATQALWLLPTGLPDPSEPGFNRAVAELSVRVLQASRGRAFLLYTSHRALNEAAAFLAAQLPYPLLVQGTAPKAELLDRFREAGNAVLLGTASFWEGVDVRGEALSVVIIDKLPFASPGDPVLQARIDALRASGGNPFFEYQLPQAVIALKQGAGRLIRDVTDRGVLVVCDRRLLSKSYGRVFVDSLPPFRRTRELDDVVRFFADPAAAGQGGQATTRTASA
ncbi:MAG: ATP-dependent DNA helicase [Gammaproteobacteria bacterium]|nr:ATP-dependent DNA helicase [Gammaproteobacteria bacterium]